MPHPTQLLCTSMMCSIDYSRLSGRAPPSKTSNFSSRPLPPAPAPGGNGRSGPPLPPARSDPPSLPSRVEAPPPRVEAPPPHVEAPPLPPARTDLPPPPSRTDLNDGVKGRPLPPHPSNSSHRTSTSEDSKAFKSAGARGEVQVTSN